MSKKHEMLCEQRIWNSNNKTNKMIKTGILTKTIPTCFLSTLTLFRTGGVKRPPPTSFSPVTSTNVGIRPENFLTFSFNPFERLV